MAQLTEQQIRYFETFGCLKFPGLFADDINAITDAFEQTWADFVAKSGRAHDDKHRSSFGPFVDQSEYLSSLIGDPRIGGIASSVLGDDCNFVSSDSAYYVGDTAWHSDRCDEGWGPDRRDEGWFPGRLGGKKHPSLKMALYLDPITRDTGCLRVIPGSHRTGDRFAESVHKGSASSASVDRSDEQWGIGGSEVPALALEVEPGDLVMFDMCIKHASFGGGTRRRGFMYAFEARYEEADLWVLREYMESHNEERYGEKMIGTVSPAGMRHLEQKLAVAEAMRGSVAGVES